MKMAVLHTSMKTSTMWPCRQPRGWNQDPELQTGENAHGAGNSLHGFQSAAADIFEWKEVRLCLQQGQKNIRLRLKTVPNEIRRRTKSRHGLAPFLTRGERPCQTTQNYSYLHHLNCRLKKGNYVASCLGVILSGTHTKDDKFCKSGSHHCTCFHSAPYQDVALSSISRKEYSNIMSFPSYRLKLQSEKRKSIKRKRPQLYLDLDYNEPMPDKQTVLYITERMLRTYPEERYGMPLLCYVLLMNTIRLLEKKRVLDFDLAPEEVVNELAEFPVAQSRQENLSKQENLPSINSFLSASDVSDYFSHIEYCSSDPWPSDSSTETDSGTASVFGGPDSIEMLPVELELLNYGNSYCFEDPGNSHMTESSSQELFTSQDGSCLGNQGGSDMTELLPVTQLAQSQDYSLSDVQSSSFSCMYSCTQLDLEASTSTSVEMNFDATMPVSSPVSSDVYPIPSTSVPYVQLNPEASASSSSEMAFDTSFLPSILPHYYSGPTPFNVMDYNSSSPPAPTGHDPSVNLVAENENSVSSQGPNDSGLNLAEADASLFFSDPEEMNMIDSMDWNETAD